MTSKDYTPEQKQDIVQTAAALARQWLKENGNEQQQQPMVEVKLNRNPADNSQTVLQMTREKYREMMAIKAKRVGLRIR